MKNSCNHNQFCLQCMQEQIEVAKKELQKLEDTWPKQKVPKRDCCLHHYSLFCECYCHNITAV